MTLPSEAPRRKIPSWVPQVLGYAIAAASLIWVLHGFPYGEMIPAIQSLDWKWMVIAVAADLAIYFAQAWRWKTLLGPVVRLGYWRTTQALYIGVFANEVLPLRVGELIRCYLLAHWNDLRLSLSFASAVVERLIDGVFMLLTFILTAAFVRGIPEDLMLLVQFLGVLLVVGVVILGWVVLHKQHAHAVLSENRWYATVRHIIEGLHLMGNRRTMGLTSLLSLLYLAFQIFATYALMKAYGLDLSFWVAGGVLAIVRLGTMVPNAPGNVGLVNVATVLALRLFDVELNDAKTFSFIMLFALSIPLIIAGAVAVALTGLSIGELHHRARHGVAASKTAPAAEEP